MAFKDIYPEAADEAEALEKWLLESFRVDEAQLRRLAVFILAHAAVDHQLIMSLPPERISMSSRN